MVLDNKDRLPVNIAAWIYATEFIKGDVAI